jgi:hypothetical protein
MLRRLLLSTDPEAVLGDFQDVSDLNAGVPGLPTSSFRMAGGSDEHAGHLKGKYSPLLQHGTGLMGHVAWSQDIKKKKGQS